MAYIEIRDGRYFAAMWMRRDDEGPYGKGADVLAALWQDPGGPFHFSYRIRSYVDDKAWESADEHIGAVGVYPEGTSEAEALRKADTAIGALPFSGPVHKIILRTDRASVVAAALKREKFTHGREVDPKDPSPPHGYVRRQKPQGGARG